MDTIKNCCREFFRDIPYGAAVEWLWTDNSCTWDGKIPLNLLAHFVLLAPRISVADGFLGLTVISLPANCHEEEEEIIDYGLGPMVRAGILDTREAGEIIDWYENVTDPNWSGDEFEKKFRIDRVQYLLKTIVLCKSHSTTLYRNLTLYPERYMGE